MIARIKRNVEAIRADIDAACSKAGRSLSDVTLVAVSKTVGLDEVKAAVAANVHDFGENRTSLFMEKHAAFPRENWHFIGSIQTNKIKDFVGKADLVHSVASDRALDAISKRACTLDVTQKLLIEVNTSREASKDGIQGSELNRILEKACELKGIKVVGLMTMAAPGDILEAQKCFAYLRELRDRHAGQYGATGIIELTELSMGMSDDFGKAVEEGATIVRIGRSVWH